MRLASIDSFAILETQLAMFALKSNDRFFPRTDVDPDNPLAAVFVKDIVSQTSFISETEKEYLDFAPPLIGERQIFFDLVHINQSPFILL